MYEPRRPRRILLATDGSPSADAALDVLCAMRFDPDDRVDVISVGYDGAEEVTRRAAEQLRCCGIAAQIRIASGPVTDTIVESARAVGADLIVIGSRGRGIILGTLLGSTARALTRTSPFPVLIARDRRVAPQRVLLAVDGSPDSQAAANAISTIPLARDAEIVLLHVVPDTRKDSTRSRDLLSLVASRLPTTIDTRIEVARGDVPTAILSRAAAHGSDLIALGSGSRPTAPLRGTTADRILSGAHCCVLVAPAADRVMVRESVQPRATMEISA